ncbi:MAG: SspB family protein [Paracoccaceae bacterium]
MSETIDYANLMHHAMRNLMAEVLRGVARDGLPGDHHFFITFKTDAPGVVMPDWLRSDYPAEITVVMQEWFADLVVDEQAFSVTLNFSDDEVRLTIPFESILTFVDPSVEFGLRFEPAVDDTPEEEDESGSPDATADADIVPLDKFRK